MLNSKTILLVEDDPSDILIAKWAFEKADVTDQLVVFEDGEKALAYLFGTGSFADRDTSEIPALILLDLELPRLNGLEVLRRIRSNPATAPIPVVILTTSDRHPDVASAYALGVNSYIQKPVSFNDFVEAVQKLGSYWLGLNQPPFVTT